MSCMVASLSASMGLPCRSSYRQYRELRLPTFCRSVLMTELDTMEIHVDTMVPLDSFQVCLHLMIFFQIS